MQTIKPLSAVDLELTQANFPALQHAFTRASVSGGTLTDLIGNAIFRTTDGATYGNLSLFGETGFGQPLSNILEHVSGAFVAPGASDFALIVTGNYSTITGVTLGFTTSAGPGVRAQPGQNNIILRTTSNSHALPALAVTSNITGIAVTRSGNVSYKYGCNASQNLVTVAGTATGTIDGAWAALANGMAIPDSLTLYSTGIYFFVFASGLPSAAEMSRAISWMSANPGKVYPGFAGKA